MRLPYQLYLEPCLCSHPYTTVDEILTRRER